MTIRTSALRTRLAVTLGCLFLAGMVALYFAASYSAVLAADRSYDRLLTGSALSIAETLSVADQRVTVDIPYAALDMLSAAPDDRVFYHVSKNLGETVTGYADLPAAPKRLLRGGQQATGAEPEYYDALYRGEKVRFVTLRREVSQAGEIHKIAVQIGQTRLARDKFARSLLFGALAPILLMTFFALVVVWFGIKAALRPLTQIGTELAQREPDELGQLQTPVPSDVAPLVDALNLFMGRLSANIDVLKNFIADAAHQIRTPLAAISAQAQLADIEDPGELASSIAAIQRHTRRLTRLVNQLLSDATTLHRSDVRQFAECDLVHIVRVAIRESVPISEDSDVRFTSTLSSAPLRGDELMINEAIKNLLHNALVHGRGYEAKVMLRLDADGDDYLLSVSDHGPGIPEAKRGQVFERHTRASSRALGAGLGMAIVARVVATHCGSIELSDRAGGGLCVAVRFPGNKD